MYRQIALNFVTSDGDILTMEIVFLAKHVGPKRPTKMPNVTLTPMHTCWALRAIRCGVWVRVLWWHNTWWPCWIKIVRWRRTAITAHGRSTIPCEKTKQGRHNASPSSFSDLSQIRSIYYTYESIQRTIPREHDLTGDYLFKQKGDVTMSNRRLPSMYDAVRNLRNLPDDEIVVRRVDSNLPDLGSDDALRTLMFIRDNKLYE